MATRFSPKRESLEEIIENLQCYNCKAIPGPNRDERNRYNCVNNSHTLCETCKAKCNCGSLVGKCPNPTIHQILEKLPVPWFCPHYKTGCREKFLKAEDIDGHQCLQLAKIFLDIQSCNGGKTKEPTVPLTFFERVDLGNFQLMIHTCI